MDATGIRTMPKKASPLTPLAVSRLKAPGLHSVGTVDGLALQVTPTGARSWVLRMLVAGKRREMGLGSYPSVTLAGAHEAARVARSKVREGTDPIGERKALQSALLAARAGEKTFADCASAYIAAHESGWKNRKHAAQWRSTLEQYARPLIGNMLVRDVSKEHVLAVLQPIWADKTETATRLRARIEKVLDYATSSGYRDGLNPARWKGHLENLLAKPGKIAKVKHHRALPYSQVGEFMLALRAQDGIGARALEFAILTAARSGEVRGSTWHELDFEAAVWTIPATRMKAGKEHRVPLSNAAVKVLRAVPRIAGIDYVFASPRAGQLSDMTLSAVMRRMKIDAVPHGFRSTFRDWAAEQTNYPREAAEMALAHTIGDKVEAAYRRGDLFERRALMMRDWAQFCGRTAAPAKVIPIKRKAKGVS